MGNSGSPFPANHGPHSLSPPRCEDTIVVFPYFAAKSGFSLSAFGLFFSYLLTRQVLCHGVHL